MSLKFVTLEHNTDGSSFFKEERILDMSDKVTVNFDENGVGESFGTISNPKKSEPCSAGVTDLLMRQPRDFVFAPIFLNSSSVRYAKAHLDDVKGKLCLRSLFGMQHYSEDAFNEALELRWSKLIEEAKALD